MKAVVVHGQGDLRVDTLPDPVPGPGEVLLAVEWGGICGSDLSYVAHGSSGTAILKHPLVLGHEFAGRVAMLGEGVSVPLGLRAAVYPPTLSGDGELPARIAGRVNLYPRVSYYGSAALDPHTDGGFSQFKVVRPDQLLPLPPSVDTKRGALAEPLGVALHAAHRAEAGVPGGVVGRSVLVNGAGPIGALTVAAVKRLGAAHVVAADLSDAALAVAAQLGADETVNATRSALPTDMELVFEASGAPGALGAVLRATAAGGTLVQVGNLSAKPVTAILGDLVTREITWLGSFRFVNEMREAIDLLADGLYVDPVMTHEFPIDQAEAAFRTAADRASGSSKVMLKLI
ncbi:MAG: L-idonate 5-dehydrogenase [Propionibacteriaceae bacterium]|jgi:L-idonate 5-dehydrogenase|nr:L-idonate 5-dehydrogenase [Propionibacteriaceae bacterium]